VLERYKSRLHLTSSDSANKALEVLTLKEGRYELHCCVEKGKLASLVLAALEFDLPEIQ
jgi:hypothetical protein